MRHLNKVFLRFHEMTSWQKLACPVGRVRCIIFPSQQLFTRYGASERAWFHTQIQVHSVLSTWAHLCKLHGGLLCIAFCLLFVVCSLSVCLDLTKKGENNSYLISTCPSDFTCYWVHSKKNAHQQMSNVLLLWQVGLIANVNLHFFFFASKFTVVFSGISLKAKEFLEILWM